MALIVATGGIVLRGGFKREVKINLPGGAYDPAAARVTPIEDPFDAGPSAAGFAKTVDSALRDFQAAEGRWSSFTPGPGGFCAEPLSPPTSTRSN